MPRKIPQALISHAAEMVRNGSTVKEAAATIPMHPDNLSTKLKQLGVSIYHGGMRGSVLQLPEEGIIKDYQAGEGTPVLAARYGCCTATISAVLVRHSVRQRTREEANVLIAAAKSPEQRREGVAHARQKRLENLRAASFDARISNPAVGTSYHFIADALLAHGEPVLRQIPFRSYYIDLTLHGVAIEVEYCPILGMLHKQTRLHKLIEAGTFVIYIVHDGLEGLTRRADKLIPLLQTSCRNPPSGSQYRVIRCGLERGIACTDYDQRSRVVGPNDRTGIRYITD